MSVIGLTVSLTQRLTLSRSRQAACVIAMSRGWEGPLLQSAGLSEQNSTQPIGARVASPRLAYRGRSSAAFAEALNPNRMAATANPFCSLNPNIVVPVFLVGTTFRI